MLSTLRYTAIAEGISYLALAITMTLKYIYEIKWPNMVVGQIHGILFICFCVLVLIAAKKYKWDFKKTIILLISSLIPFGTFWAEKQYLRGEEKNEELLDN